MSGEFGSYVSGYLDTQIETAAEDLANGMNETTKAWAPLLDAFVPIARAICRSEAGNSSEAVSIEESIRQLPALRAALDDVVDRMKPFAELQHRAVEQALRERG